MEVVRFPRHVLLRRPFFASPCASKGIPLGDMDQAPSSVLVRNILRFRHSSLLMVLLLGAAFSLIRCGLTSIRRQSRLARTLQRTDAHIGKRL